MNKNILKLLVNFIPSLTSFTSSPAASSSCRSDLFLLVVQIVRIA
jgi:hypothetical protein